MLVVIPIGASEVYLVSISLIELNKIPIFHLHCAVVHSAVYAVPLSGQYYKAFLALEHRLVSKFQ